MTKTQKRMLRRILAAGALFTLGLAAKYIVPASVGAYLSPALFIAAWALAGYPVLLEAGENLIHGNVFDENFLMAIATLGAMALQDWAEAAGVMIFYQIGELFEHVAVHRSRQSISALMELRPDTAVVLENGAERQVLPEQIAIGDILLVRPGERIAVDGTIVHGQATLDSSKITGEAKPVDVGAGEFVLSGCVNLSGVLQLRAESAYSQSTVAKILELVESASDQKAQTERLITRFARFYTPSVVIGAVLLAILPPLLFSASWAIWIKRALTFLVISCPCALVISVPLSYFGGLGAASRLGIVVKGGTVLEQLAKAKIAVFDKTGTLTSGKFEVQQVICAQGTEPALLSLAAAAESYCTHPVAQAVLAHAGPATKKPEQAEELPGRGVCAVLDGKRVLVGNAKLMEQFGIAYTPIEAVGTVVYCAMENRYLGAILVGDSLREGAGQAMRALKALGIEKTLMLTGDLPTPAELTAKAVGLDAYYAKLLPQDKVEKMQALLAQRGSGTLLFAGDGVNDAPVLALADVGIAMGGVGSDAAVEAADVVILNDDLQKLPAAIRIARKTNRIAKENILFALLVKAVVLALGALGYAPMWLAIFADVGVAVLAILNALRTMQRPAKAAAFAA